VGEGRREPTGVNFDNVTNSLLLSARGEWIGTRDEKTEQDGCHRGQSKNLSMGRGKGQDTSTDSFAKQNDSHRSIVKGIAFRVFSGLKSVGWIRQTFSKKKSPRKKPHEQNSNKLVIGVCPKPKFELKMWGGEKYSPGRGTLQKRVVCGMEASMFKQA